MMMMMHLPTRHSQEATEADVIEPPLSDPEEDEEEEQEQEQEHPPTTAKKKTSSKNKRRFSDEQVRSLETIFASETKLEPKKKVQVAKELGLQPRQVAIWFQNKRARWKSKQIEKNYRVLKANYDSLKARFEAMKEEKESLLKQLQELRNLLEKPQKSESKDSAVAATELPVKSSSLQEEVDHQGIIYSDDDKSGNMAHLCHDEPEPEPELMQLSENIDGSAIKWCSFDAVSLFDQSSTSSYWWDSWT